MVPPKLNSSGYKFLRDHHKIFGYAKENQDRNVISVYHLSHRCNKTEICNGQKPWYSNAYKKWAF